MITGNNKKVVCITGSVWTGSRNAPRYMLVKHGFLRPFWFTTGRPVTDARYKVITTAEYHGACAEGKVLASMKYGGDFDGIMTADFNDARKRSRAGVLVVGPQEMIAQIAGKVAETIIFALKDIHMELSPYLVEADQKGQLHRLNINVIQPGAWSKANREIIKTLGLSVTTRV